MFRALGIALFLFIFLVAFNGYSKESKVEKATLENIVFGFKSGMNISTWRGAKDFGYGREPFRPYEERSTKIGINGAFFFALQIGKYHEVLIETQFTQKGYRFKTIKNQYPALTVNYLEIPLLIKMGARTFGVYAGPALSFKTGVSMKNNIEMLPYDAVVAYDTSLAPFDVGIAYGFVFNFGKGPGKLLLDFRGTHGLLKVFKYFDAFVDEEILKQMGIPTHKNIAFSVSIGVSIDKKINKKK